MTPISRRFPLSTGITLAGDLYIQAQGVGPETPLHDTPLVLFLHGGGQTRHAWGGAAERLAEEGFPALSIDHRGHGDSSWARDGDYLFPRFADDLEALLPLLGAKPIVVGASLGGLSAMAVEARQPGVTDGIVLVDVTPRLEREGVMRIIEFMMARKDGFASLDEVSEYVASFLPHRPRPKSTAGLEKNLRRGEDGRYRWHWDPCVLDAWKPGRYSDSEAQELIEQRLEGARRLSVPALLVRGRMSDVVSEESAQEFLACCPHAEYVDLEGAAHMVAGDKNDAFGDVVLDFVRRLRHK
ncbi:MAG: alpha/beta hydrolase [Polyangiales bacterium]|nr:alpha/beta hydrolase [Myxococcales bacterium]MCB9660079.1 alpha/beta hydrolase [Sandaracinaceae bacterium]